MHQSGREKSQERRKRQDKIVCMIIKRKPETVLKKPLKSRSNKVNERQYKLGENGSEQEDERKQLIHWKQREPALRTRRTRF